MNNENGFRTTIVSGIFILPFVSLLVFSSLYFPYITGKNLVFRVIVLVIAALYAWLIYKDKDYVPKFGAVGWSFVAFLAILFVANIFGINPHKSFFSNFERMEGFFTILLLFFYFTILTGVLKTERTWERLLNTSLAASVIMAVFALAEQSTGVGRLSAQLGNSTYLGAYMLFHIFIALFLMVRYVERVNFEPATRYTAILTYLGIIILDFYVFYFTGTRGALLGLFGGLIFISVFFACFPKASKKLRIAGIGILVLIVITIGTLYSLRNAPTIQNNPLLARFVALISAPTDFSAYATTQGKGRFAIWSIALEGVKERPVLGWGQDNFNYVFNKNYTPEIYDQEQWFDRAHNVFFDWLVAGGILGLLSYLSLFGFGFYALWRKKREDQEHHFSFSDKTILSALLIAYFVHNLFVFDSLTSYILFFTVLAYITLHERSLEITKKFNLEFLKKDGNKAALAGVFVLACMVGIYYLTILPVMASTSLIKALSLQNTVFGSDLNLTNAQRESFLKDSLESFKSSIKQGVVGRSETREQLLQGASTVVRAPNVSSSTRQAYDAEVTKEMKAQIAETPEDARYVLFYASYLNRVGRYDEAFSYFKEANKLSPNKQTILYDEGLAYINLKRYSEAVAIFKRAYESAPSNNEALSFYIMALIYSGDNVKADQLRQPIRLTPQGTHIRIIKAYDDTKQQNKIQEILNDKFALAEKYRSEGNKEEAIKIIREAIAIGPAMTTRGETLIEEIEKGQ